MTVRTSQKVVHLPRTASALFSVGDASLGLRVLRAVRLTRLLRIFRKGKNVAGMRVRTGSTASV